MTDERTTLLNVGLALITIAEPAGALNEKDTEIWYGAREKWINRCHELLDSDQDHIDSHSHQE